MGFTGRARAGARLCLLALALLPGVARSYGDVYVLARYGAGEDEDVAFGEGAQTAQAGLTPPGAGVSGSAYTAAPTPAATGQLGGSVQYDVAAATPFAFAQSDRTGAAAEAFLSDVWMPTLPGSAGEMVSLTLHVHAAGSGETRANPSLPGALGSNVLIDAGVFEAFGSGFAGALTAEAQLGYLAPPPHFVPPFFSGEWAGGDGWTVTTDSAASRQTFSYESGFDLPFQWPAGTAFEVDLFTQYFAGWCCANVDQTLGAPIHASFSHTLGYELEAANPDLQLVRLPEPASGLLLALGLWAATAGGRRGARRRSGVSPTRARRPRSDRAATFRRRPGRTGAVRTSRGRGRGRARRGTRA